tara:strand:+ start:557 stop:706 length:150 start_codon:yes stop_codon:yes gene_type:complete
MKLGDLVYYFTKYTGIRWIWKRINPDCGCDERREKWNQVEINIYRKWKK